MGAVRAGRRPRGVSPRGCDPVLFQNSIERSCRFLRVMIEESAEPLGCGCKAMFQEDATHARARHHDAEFRELSDTSCVIPNPRSPCPFARQGPESHRQHAGGHAVACRCCRTSSRPAPGASAGLCPASRSLPVLAVRDGQVARLWLPTADADHHRAEDASCRAVPVERELVPATTRFFDVAPHSANLRP